MAIVSQQPGVDEEEKKKETGQPITGGPAPQGVGGAAPGSSLGAAPQKGPSKSGSYTDIGKYLQANKPTIEKFSQGVVGGVQNQIGQGAENVQKQSEKYQQDIEGAKLDSSGVTGKKASEIDLEQGKKILEGGYTGPKQEDLSLTGLYDLQQAQKQAEQLQDFGGKKAFLQENLAKQVGDYSAGENLLDSIFLSRNPQARGQIQDLGSQAGQAINVAEQQRQALQDLIEQTKTSNTQQAADLRAQLEAQQQGISSGLGKDVDFRRSELQQNINPVVKALREAAISKAVFDAKGESATYQNNLDALAQALGLDNISGLNTTLGAKLSQASPTSLKWDSTAMSEQDIYNTLLGGTPTNFGGLSAQQYGEAEALSNLLGDSSLLQAGRYDAGQAQQGLIDFIKNNYLV